MLIALAIVAIAPWVIGGLVLFGSFAAVEYAFLIASGILCLGSIVELASYAREKHAGHAAQLFLVVIGAGGLVLATLYYVVAPWLLHVMGASC